MYVILTGYKSVMNSLTANNNKSHAGWNGPQLGVSRSKKATSKQPRADTVLQ